MYDKRFRLGDVVIVPSRRFPNKPYTGTIKNITRDELWYSVFVHQLNYSEDYKPEEIKKEVITNENS